MLTNLKSKTKYVRRVSVCGSCISHILIKDMLKYKDEELRDIQIIEDNNSPEFIFSDGCIYNHRKPIISFANL